jgi:hypothetical protein
MNNPVGTVTTQAWGGPPVCGHWTLKIRHRTDWQVNPEGCQKVAGGRFGHRGTTTGKPCPKIPHPYGVPELPFPDCGNSQVESISSGGGSGTPSGCGGASLKPARWSPPCPPSATTGYLLATLRVGMFIMSRPQGQSGGPMPMTSGLPHLAGMNAKNPALNHVSH